MLALSAGAGQVLNMAKCGQLGYRAAVTARAVQAGISVNQGIQGAKSVGSGIQKARQGDVLGATADIAMGVANVIGAKDGLSSAAGPGCFRPETLVLGQSSRGPIADVRLGQHVATTPEWEQTLGIALDAADYRVIRLSYIEPGSSREMELAFLRQASVVEGWGVGDTIPLKILEMEVQGTARVTAVLAAPPLEAGVGGRVTGTIRSRTIDLWRLKVRGLEQPIEVTGRHPVYSEDRLAYVAVADLDRGERLRTREGVGVVESVSRESGEYDVFNLEIEEVHRYYVSDVDVLAHNAGEDCLGTGGGTGQDPPLNKPSTLEPGPYANESIPARGPGRDFTAAERDQINEIGRKTGCHSCGTTNPGTKSGDFIPDHQPPNALNVSGGPQQLYPHCKTCSLRQGGQIRKFQQQSQP